MLIAACVLTLTGCRGPSYMSFLSLLLCYRADPQADSNP